MRRTLVTILAFAAALACAAPASAGTANVPNFCEWSVQRGTWPAQDIDITGTATPNPLAPGSGVALTGAAIHSRLPDWLSMYAEVFLKEGANELPTKIWAAVTGDNTAQGVQVFALETVARTTATRHEDGTWTVTPIDVTVPIPDSAWTAGTVGAVAFRQAPAGTLPPVPAGMRGAMVTPKGSVLISTTTPYGVTVTIDCQPGTEGPNRSFGTPALAAPFESVPVQVDAPVIIPAPPAVPAVALRTTKLKATGRRVKVALSCTAADCQGAVTLKAGTKSVAPKRTYSVKSGARKTYTLTLSKSAHKTLKAKKKLKVTLQVTATGGNTVTKTFTLR